MKYDKAEIAELIAKRIKYLRKQKGFSQQELAKCAGLNPTFYGQIERCQKCPTIDSLYKIAIALQIPLSEIINIDNEYSPQTENEKFKKLFLSLNNLPPKKAERVVQIIDEIIQLLCE